MNTGNCVIFEHICIHVYMLYNYCILLLKKFYYMYIRTETLSYLEALPWQVKLSGI